MLTNLCGLACAFTRVDSWLRLRKVPGFGPRLPQVKKRFSFPHDGPLPLFPPRRRKNNSRRDGAVKQGMCSAVRAVVESALANATCDGLHSYAQRAQSLPSSFSLRQLSKVKSLLFPKISKQNIYLMTCMNEWLSCMENLIPSFATSNINVLIVFTLQGYAVSEMDCSKQMSWHFHVFFFPLKAATLFLPRNTLRNFDTEEVEC